MSFDRLAPHYRWMESVLAGRKLQRCRLAFLSRARSARNVLLVGEGHGCFLGALLQTDSPARITCLDASCEMLRQAERTARTSGRGCQRVEFVHENVLHWNPSGGTFDLVVTHFFLDCFDPARLGEVIKRISAAANPRATWLLADFCEPERGPLKWRARAILSLMYGFFRVATALPAKKLTPPDDLLASHGFELVERQLIEWNLLHSDVWERDSD